MGKGPEQTFFQRTHISSQQIHVKKVINITNHWGNANQNNNEISSHTCQDVCYQKNKISGNSLVVKWLGLRAFTAKGQGSIPGQGTKIPQAVWCSQKTKQNKKTRYQMLSRIWRKRTLVYDVGSVNWYSHCGNSMEVPQEIKNRITGRLPWRSSG